MPEIRELFPQKVTAKARQRSLCAQSRNENGHVLRFPHVFSNLPNLCKGDIAIAAPQVKKIMLRMNLLLIQVVGHGVWNSTGTQLVVQIRQV